MTAQGLDPSDAIFWTEALRYAGGLDHTLMYLAFVFVLIGFGTKAGLFPMHAWLPGSARYGLRRCCWRCCRWEGR